MLLPMAGGCITSPLKVPSNQNSSMILNSRRLIFSLFCTGTNFKKHLKSMELQMHKSLLQIKSRIFLLAVNVRVWESPQCARHRMEKIKLENLCAISVCCCGKQETPPTSAPSILSLLRLESSKCITWRAGCSRMCWDKPAANSLLQAWKISLSTSFHITLKNQLHKSRATTKQ